MCVYQSCRSLNETISCLFGIPVIPSLIRLKLRDHFFYVGKRHFTIKVFGDSLNPFFIPQFRVRGIKQNVGK